MHCMCVLNYTISHKYMHIICQLYCCFKTEETILDNKHTLIEKVFKNKPFHLSMLAISYKKK